VREHAVLRAAAVALPVSSRLRPSPSSALRLCRRGLPLCLRAAKSLTPKDALDALVDALLGGV
jgi:hypothetical protein